MAEETDPKELFKKLAEVLEKGGKSLEDRIKEYQDVKNKETNGAKENNKNSKEQIELTKQLNLRKNNLEKKALEDQQRYASEQKKLVQAREITENEAKENIKNFNRSISDQIADPILKDRIEKFGSKLEKSGASVSKFEAFIGEGGERFKKDLLNVGSTVGNAAFNIAKSYRDSGSQVGVATTVLQEGAGAAGSLLSTAGNAAGAAGSALSAMGGRARIVGLGLQGLGTVAGLAGSAISQIAAKVLPVLASELNKNITAFQSMSASGALFSNGLTGMIETAGTAGMTLDQFNNVVKNNTGPLAALGEGVTAGATRAARALQAGGDGMRKQLLNLGYSVEEQGSLVAETMEIMRQSGGKLTATDAQVAEETKKYAENLRIVSSITGEDAKKKMDQIKQENTKLAFQQKMAGMDETQRANIVKAQANMSDLQRKAFQEMMVFGQVVTPELAATVAQSENLRGSVEEAVQAAQSGTLDDAKMREIQAQRGEGIKQELLSLQGIAQAGMAGVGGLVGGISESLGKELEFRNRFNETSIRNAEEGARGQAETADRLTSSMNDVVIANQKAAEEIQKAILQSGVMSTFAEQTKKATDALVDMIKKFTGEGSSSEAGSQARAEENGRTIGGAAGGVIGGVIGSALGPAGTLVGSIIGGYVGEALGGRIGSMVGGGNPAGQIPQGEGYGGSTIAQFASGGFIDGPKSGTLAMLHGKEMVLPLPDSLTPAKIGDLLSGLSEMQRQMAVEQIATGTTVSPEAAFVQAMAADQMTKMTKTDDSVPVLTRLSDQMEELLTATRLVVANTERTARGVA